MIGHLANFPGANSGLGREVATDLSKRGARVLMLCRDLEKSNEIRDEIASTADGEVDIYKLDLSSLASVRRCAKEIIDTEDKIDILINNAGIMNCPRMKTVDGFEMQFGTNHLGHFLLTELLLPAIKRSAEKGNFKPR